jgi:adenylate kinase family enzyme
MPAPFVILTGASGVGKTTLALAVEKAYPSCRVFRADTIGIPSPEVMASYGPGHQPGGAWQRAFTIQWIERLAPVVASGQTILLEGQMRIAFIREALAAHNISAARIILVECDDETRNARLMHDRLQPELANESMAGWSRYLHQEALEAGVEILDTGEIPLEETVNRIASYLNLLAAAENDDARVK